MYQLSTNNNKKKKSDKRELLDAETRHCEKNEELNKFKYTMVPGLTYLHPNTMR